MKGSIAALGMMAAVAEANPFQPRHWHFRRDNTTLPGDTETTLTVITTEVATITSCAPTVTDCPADESAIATLPESEKTTVVVTNTVALTTTVCPVSEAPEISASIISNPDITGTTLTEPPPLPTDVIPTGTGSPPISATSSALVPENPEDPENPDAPQPSLSTTVSDVTEDHTLTITQGTGSETTVKTTTIQTTYETTVVVTCTPEPGEPGSPGGPTDGPTGEPTTTTTATSTGTTTVTVPGAEETEDTKPEDNIGGGTPGNGEDDEDVDDNKTPGDNDDGSCVCPTAVTVTAPASTVYVTIGGDGPTAGVSDVAAPEPTGGNGGNGGNDGSEEDDEEDDEDDCEEIPDDGEDDEDDEDDADECEADETVTSTVSVPYPTGNGTIPTSGIPAPTGFARRLR